MRPLSIVKPLRKLCIFSSGSFLSWPSPSGKVPFLTVRTPPPRQVVRSVLLLFLAVTTEAPARQVVCWILFQIIKGHPCPTLPMLCGSQHTSARRLRKACPQVPSSRQTQPWDPRTLSGSLSCGPWWVRASLDRRFNPSSAHGALVYRQAPASCCKTLCPRL